MKKQLLLSAALLAAAGAFAQQSPVTQALTSRMEARPTTEGMIRLQAPAASQMPAVLNNTPAVEAPQTRAGELTMPMRWCEEPYKAFGLSTSELTLGIIFPAQYLAEFAGNQLVNILVAAPYSADISSQSSQLNGVKNCTVELRHKTTDAEPFYTQAATLGSAAFAWNTIKLDTPCDITGTEDILVCIKYENLKETDYALITDYTQYNDYSTWIYAKVDATGAPSANFQWNNIGSSVGATCMYAEVAGDNLPQNRAAVLDASSLYSAEPGRTEDFTVAFINQGANDVNSVELTFSVQGQADQVQTCQVYTANQQTGQLVLNPAGYNEYGYLGAQFKFEKEGIDVPFTVQITKINGNAPEVQYEPYSGTMNVITPENGYDINVVCEELTSTTCVACPIGITGMEQMTENYGIENGGRFIPIAIHCPIPSAGDPMDVITSQSSQYYDFMAQIGSTPASRMMRHMNEDVYPQPSTLQSYYEMWADSKTFAKVDATLAPGDEGKQQVKVNVTSTFSMASEGKYGLAYTVTEDGLGPYNQRNGYSGAQYDAFGWESKGDPTPVMYDHVVRTSLFTPRNATRMNAPTAGQTFEHELTISLATVTNTDNYGITVMLVDIATGEIINAAYCKGNSTLAVDAVEGAAVRPYAVEGGVQMPAAGDIYAIDGRIVARNASGLVNLPAGVYVARTADATAKILVK